MHIAVIGTGISGNGAAWALSSQHQVTVYEQDQRPGGHSHTVEIDYDGAHIAVDTGFIVYNEHNYPELTALFAHLGVETVASDMSFSVSADQGRFEWMGGGNRFSEIFNGLFAQRRNLFSPSYLWMLKETLRFNELSVQDLANGYLAGLTLGDYLTRRGFAGRLASDYLVPMGAAIWSTPTDEMLNFPAENFVAFFDNHRLLQLDRPVWRTVKGGSARYVEKLTDAFRPSLRLGTGVVSIERTARGVVVRDSLGGQNTYDQVVIASHSDQALAMLSDASDAERAVLGSIRTRPNKVYLHRDVSLMPKRQRAWAAWNFRRSDTGSAAGSEVAVTYWMNRLQGIDPAKPLFVSLNPPVAPAPHKTFAQFSCNHPQFDLAAFDAQTKLDSIQGERRTWFCGAWTGYGFHEDGLRSGLNVAERLGAIVPWRQPRAELRQAAE